MKDTADCFGRTWLKTPSTKKCRHFLQISIEGFLYLSLSCQTYIVSIDEFSWTCWWKVIDVNIEETWGQHWARKRPFFLILQELVLSPICTRKRLSRRNIATVSTTQVGRTLESFRSRPKCQTVSYAAVKSRKTAPVFCLSWKPFSMNVERVWVVDIPRQTRQNCVTARWGLSYVIGGSVRSTEWPSVFWCCVSYL